VNNIVWHNRSYYNDASLNGGAGGLAANPAGLYQDLGVINTTGLHFLSPLDCILTSTAGYDSSNQATDPGFVLEYFNTLSSATVTDEGGNSINVTYPELTVSLGDYHLGAGSPAIDAGRFVNLHTDFDSEYRPMGYLLDIGADEYPGPIYTDTLGLVRGNTWMLEASLPPVAPVEASFTFGLSSDAVFVGDWNGDGIKTPGVRRGNTWMLRNSNSAGPANITFTFGNSSDTPVVGDWDGDGIDTIGTKRGNTYRLRNTNSSGSTNIQFTFGNSSDTPVVGDWDGDGIDTIGTKRGNTYRLRNTNSSGPTNIQFSFGFSSDTPVVGDWDGDGVDSIGLKRGNNYMLRNGTSGPADFNFSFGLSGDRPIAGKWGL
jgi:hypothetical protein